MLVFCTVSEFDDLRSLTGPQQVIRVYESSKMCPEVISPLDFECEKASIQHLTPQCKDTCDGRHLHMHEPEDAATFKMQASCTMSSNIFNKYI